MKTLTLFAAHIAASSAYSFGFSDITSWSGTGSNEAALIIDWADGGQPASLVWGYRWDGSATGFDLLGSVMASDSRLTRVFGGGGPASIFGLGYDTDGDGLPLIGSGESAAPADAGDHYRAGWFVSGFWAQFVAGNTTELPTSWSWGNGLSDSITANSWTGLSFGPGFNAEFPSPPSNPPVPEPASILVLGLGFACITRANRK